MNRLFVAFLSIMAFAVQGSDVKTTFRKDAFDENTWIIPDRDVGMKAHVSLSFGTNSSGALLGPRIQVYTATEKILGHKEIMFKSGDKILRLLSPSPRRDVFSGGFFEVSDIDCPMDVFNLFRKSPDRKQLGDTGTFYTETGIRIRVRGKDDYEDFEISLEDLKAAKVIIDAFDKLKSSTTPKKDKP
jgi:hypothetical protein